MLGKLFWILILSAPLWAASGKWRVLRIERVWDQKVQTSVIAFREGNQEDKIRTGGALIARLGEDVLETANSLEEIEKNLKADLCGKPFEAPLTFLADRPQPETYPLGLGRYLPVKANYKAKAPVRVEFRYLKPEGSFLEYGRIICNGREVATRSPAPELCVSGLNPLHLDAAAMTVKLRVNDIVTESRIAIERAIGGAHQNWVDLHGFFTQDELLKKYCGRTVIEFPVLYYPSYEGVIGQNGFYWYLNNRPLESKPTTHLMIVEGKINGEKCEEMLEGANRSVIVCPE